jgi:hypothetical protein
MVWQPIMPPTSPYSARLRVSLTAQRRLDKQTDVQRKVIARHQMAHRAEVVEADMCSDEGKSRLQAADVVVLHNVFEFFGDAATVERSWAAVRCVNRVRRTADQPPPPPPRHPS